jgi:hypothetical protein
MYGPFVRGGSPLSEANQDWDMTIALLLRPKQSFLKAPKIFPLDGTSCFCKIGAALLSRNRGRRREVQAVLLRVSFYTYYRVEQH